eukprot:scaffold110771_cov71-Attheya_sp.AAC.2
MVSFISVKTGRQRWGTVNDDRDPLQPHTLRKNGVRWCGCVQFAADHGHEAICSFSSPCEVFAYFWAMGTELYIAPLGHVTKEQDSKRTNNSLESS